MRVTPLQDHEAIRAGPKSLTAIELNVNDEEQKHGIMRGNAYVRPLGLSGQALAPTQQYNYI